MIYVTVLVSDFRIHKFLLPPKYLQVPVLYPFTSAQNNMKSEGK